MARAELMGQGLSHFSIPGIWGCLGLVKDVFVFLVVVVLLLKTFGHSKMSFPNVGYMPM